MRPPSLIFYPAEIERLDRLASRVGIVVYSKGRPPGLPPAEDERRARVARRAMAIGLALLEDDPSIFEAEL